MNILKKIQNLSPVTRKIILWSIMVTLGICLFILYVKEFQGITKKISEQGLKENLKFPNLQLNAPVLETPENQ